MTMTSEALRLLRYGLRFGKYPDGWHTHGEDAETAIDELVKLELVETKNTNTNPPSRLWRVVMTHPES